MIQPHTARPHCAQYLYVLGIGSRWQNNELRYSLRSLDAFCPMPKHIYIAGERPEFINWGRSDGITHIPLPEIGGSKVQHVGRKLIGAMPYLRERDFVLMNDDFILTRAHDCTREAGPFAWGRRHAGLLTERLASIKPKYRTSRVSYGANAAHGSMYYRAILKSFQFLQTVGEQPWLAYNVHEPMDLSADLVLNTGAACPFWEGYSFRILYGNLHSCEFDRSVPAVVDMKIAGQELIPAGVNSISLSSAVRDPMQTWLANRFQKKSRWEK